MKVRQMAERLRDLQARGFGDEHVQIEVGGAGTVTEVVASSSMGVWLKTSSEK